MMSPKELQNAQWVRDSLNVEYINRILKRKTEFENDTAYDYDDVESDWYDRYDDGYLQALEDVLDELR